MYIPYDGWDELASHRILMDKHQSDQFVVVRSVGGVAASTAGNFLL